MKPMNKSFALWIAVFFAAVFFPSLRAQAECAELSRELIVGIKEAPPFSLKDEKGDWMGISVELWRRIATELCIRYRFVEVDDVGSLLRGVNAGDFDLAVAAITITPSRARDVDFTFPYLRIGTGVAVRADPTASWRPVIRSIGSYGFLQAVSALLALSFLTGLLIWLCERRTNDGFGGGTSRGISAAIWWSTTAMTQRIGGGVVPVTVPGRVLALIWMVVSVIAVAVFTAGLTSALTSRRLQGVVTRVADESRCGGGNRGAGAGEPFANSLPIAAERAARLGGSAKWASGCAGS